MLMRDKERGEIKKGRGRGELMGRVVVGDGGCNVPRVEKKKMAGVHAGMEEAACREEKTVMPARVTA
jgi:hypothetical protein